MTLQHGILEGRRAPSAERIKAAKDELDQRQQAAERAGKIASAAGEERDKAATSVQGMIQRTADGLKEALSKGIIIDSFNYEGSDLKRVIRREPWKQEFLTDDDDPLRPLPSGVTLVWGEVSEADAAQVEWEGAIVTDIGLIAPETGETPNADFSYRVQFDLGATTYECALAAIQAHPIV